MWILILIILNIPVYKWIFKQFFKSGDEFAEAIKYNFTPDIVSLFKGNYRKDRIAEIKLGAFIMCCILLIGLEYSIINSIYNLF